MSLTTNRRMFAMSLYVTPFAGVASDRLSINSRGLYTSPLSPQHLLDCDADHKQTGCRGGYTDRAWWFMRKSGSVKNLFLNMSTSSKEMQHRRRRSCVCS